MQTYFSISPELRMASYKKIEKYLVRKAFESENLLPSEVLWRTKEALSDGVSSQESPWHMLLREHVNTMVTDEEFENNKMKYNIPPMSKEAYYYRHVCFLPFFYFYILFFFHNTCEFA